MIPELNKAIVLRWFEEVANQGKLGVADSIFAENYIDHDPPSPTEVWPTGAEGAKQSLAAYQTAFPDLHYTVEHVIADGQTVAVRYTFDGTHRGLFLGIPSTGKQVRFTGISLFHIIEDKIVESWGQFDLLDFIQQVGTWPQPDQPTPNTPAERGPIV
jgi:steroid delta-isomerase-like uncharacterized protein